MTRINYTAKRYYDDLSRTAKKWRKDLERGLGNGH